MARESAGSGVFVVRVQPFIARAVRWPPQCSNSRRGPEHSHRHVVPVGKGNSAMAMLTARFDDAAAADRIVRTLVDALGAAPTLVIVSPEAARPDPATDAGSQPGAVTAMPARAAVRVAIHDNAIASEKARAAFEAGGGSDIRPIE